MAYENLTNKYFVKNNESDSYQDVTTLFDGVRVLKVDGLTTIGEAINVYNEQWVDGTEEFYIASEDMTIKRKNVDIEIVFIVGDRYLSNDDNNIDVQTIYNEFVDYMTAKDVWIKSTYTNQEVHCYCKDGVTPTSVKLQRGHGRSYILAKITMHTLEKPKRN